MFTHNSAGHPPHLLVQSLAHSKNVLALQTVGPIVQPLGHAFVAAPQAGCKLLAPSYGKPSESPKELVDGLARRIYLASILA